MQSWKSPLTENESPGYLHPTLPLPPVAAAIEEGRHYAAPKLTLRWRHGDSRSFTGLSSLKRKVCRYSTSARLWPM